jgi:hypothetical protein
VQAAKAQHPDCSFQESRSVATRFINGKGSETTERNYYMQCPGKRPQLIHRSSSSKDLSGDGGDGGGEQQYLDRSPFSLFPHGGGDESEDAFQVQDMDAFLRDFFGIPEDRASRMIPLPPSASRQGGGHSGSGNGGGERGIFPFPFPLPRPQVPSQTELEPWANHNHKSSSSSSSNANDDSGNGGGSNGDNARVPSMVQRERGKGVYI